MSHWKIAAAQYPSEHSRVDDHIADHLRFMTAAAQQQCHLLVFPELSLTGPTTLQDALPPPPAPQQLGPLLDAAHTLRLSVIAGTTVEIAGKRMRGLACFTPGQQQVALCPQERGACLVQTDSSLMMIDAHSDSPGIDARAALLTRSLAANENAWPQYGDRMQRYAHKYAIAVLMANRNNSALWDARGQLIVRADCGELLVTGRFAAQGWQGDIIPLR